MSIFEFNRRFPTEESAIDFIIDAKYKDGVYVCPKCGCIHNIYRSNVRPRNLYCNNCNSHFSALAGTIFENTHLDLRMWLYAINLVMVARKGISACQLQRYEVICICLENASHYSQRYVKRGVCRHF